MAIPIRLSRWSFAAGLCPFLWLSASLLAAADTPPANPSPRHPANFPSMLEADGALRFAFADEHLVLEGGLQPSLLVTKTGALIVQGQIPEKPVPTARMHYPSAVRTVVSRDEGKTWTTLPLKPGDNGVNLEGGITQLRDGTIVALDTYIVPSPQQREQGIGQLYVSHDDWKTVSGPQDVIFDLPNTDYPSKDDGGRPHEAQRLHRRILELPNGDLVTTFYGWVKGDNTPSTYEPRMMKSRVMLARSSDHGLHWRFVSTVAVGPSIGTEGFGEPVITRVSQGPSAGRLICLMRTGRELYEATSDDEGATWSPARPRVFAGLDIYRTELWVNMFRHIKGRSGRLLDERNVDELPGAVVDPDLIELRSGLLVAAFGVRITQKGCWVEPRHPWNGNYLAVSRDHGQTWTNVVRLTSGVETTHYMAIEETPTDNRIYVTYDLGTWGKGFEEIPTDKRGFARQGPGRDIYGRYVDISKAP